MGNYRKENDSQELFIFWSALYKGWGEKITIHITRRYLNPAKCDFYAREQVKNEGTAVKEPISVESICPWWQICEEHHDAGKVTLAVNGPFFSCDCLTFQES